MLFLTFFMIFIVVLAVLRMRASHSEKNRTEAFLNRENQANNTRRVDLSTVEGFSFPVQDLPLPPEENEELSLAYGTIRDLSQKKMMNLNGKSNTDLKLEYGPQNLEELTEYGDNFSALEQALLTYGKLLYEKKHPSEAVRVLERGIALPTDLMENYELLAKIYEETGVPRKRDGLKTMAEANLTGYARETVLRQLSGA